jgi:hypothetical protein
VIVDRSSVPLEPAFPILSLGAIQIPSWHAGDCPLCAAGEPLTRPGSS